MAGGGWPNIALSGAPDRRWNSGDLSSLTRIHASDFEAVDESSLQVSPDSGQVRVPTTSTPPTPEPTKTHAVSPWPSPVPTNAAVPIQVEVAESDESRGIAASGGWMSTLLITLAGLTFLLALTLIGIRYRLLRKRGG